MKQRNGSIFLWILIAAGVVAAAFFLLLVIAVPVYLFVGQPNQIKGRSMEPNYHNGEYIFTNKIDYRSSDPKRGDVVIFKSPTNPDIDFIERVVGLPGEKLKISQGKVFINDSELDESKYVLPNVYTGPEAYLSENKEVTVPGGQYFLLGDNRPHASDSRERGPIPKAYIIGRVDFCYWYCQGQ